MLGRDGAVPQPPAHRPPAWRSHLGPGAAGAPRVPENGCCGRWALEAALEAWALSPTCDCGSNLRAFACVCRTQEHIGQCVFFTGSLLVFSLRQHSSAQAALPCPPLTPRAQHGPSTQNPTRGELQANPFLLHTLPC